MGAGGRWRDLVRVGGAVVAIALAVAAVGPDMDRVWAVTTGLGWPAVLTATGLAVASVLAAGATWRSALASLGSPRPWAATTGIFLVSQLGKYLPGSVWPVLAQMDMAHRQGVPRARSAAAFALAMIASVAVGAVLAVTAVPSALPDVPMPWVLVLVPLVASPLHPRVLARVLRLAERLARRGLRIAVPEGRAMGRLAGWSALNWFLLAGHAVALAAGMTHLGPRGVLTVAGAFALAWVVGFLVVIAPAGAGVREAVLVVALTGVLGREEALALALVSRTLLTLVDIVAAGVGVVVERRHVITAVPPSVGGA